MKSLPLILLLAVSAGACGGDDGGGTGLCDLEIVSATLDASFDHGSVDALIEAGGRFAATVQGLDSELKGACNDMNMQLGAAQGATTQTACDNFRAALAAKLQANPAVALVVSVSPPICTASAAATIDCVADCDASFDATATPPTCTGGELSGMCSAQCMGECTIEGSATCTGSCSGMCSGSCSGTVSGQCTGTCNGQCDGTCSAMDASGNCTGTCTGTCEGSCSGTVTGQCNGACSGSCSGECRATVAGSCSGSCTGDCSVAFTEPKCEGGHFDVQADANCKAACESRSSFDLDCTAAQVVVTFTGSPTAAADLAAISVALETNLPRILDVAVRIKAIAAASANLASAAKNAAGDAASAGLKAVACLAEAANAAVSAAATLQVDVSVSVQVQGSVTGG